MGSFVQLLGLVLLAGCRSTSADMVLIEPGRFQMGSPESEVGRFDEETQVDVEITRAFLLGRYEVTQGQWRSRMGNNPSEFPSCGRACPVESVSWWDAVAYANALSESEGLQACYTLSGCNGRPGDLTYSCSGVTFAGLNCTGYRLPTEAEWEYAARAGTTGARHGSLDAVAWHYENSGSGTRPVGGKAANAWGLHDMLGNVFEWTNDWYDANLRGGSDPLGPSTGSRRVARGGSWGSPAPFVRAGIRVSYDPGFRDHSSFGFRLARTAP